MAFSYSQALEKRIKTSRLCSKQMPSFKRDAVVGLGSKVSERLEVRKGNMCTFVLNMVKAPEPVGRSQHAHQQLRGTWEELSEGS